MYCATRKMRLYSIIYKILADILIKKEGKSTNPIARDGCWQLNPPCLLSVVMIRRLVESNRLPSPELIRLFRRHILCRFVTSITAQYVTLLLQLILSCKHYLRYSP